MVQLIKLMITWYLSFPFGLVDVVVVVAGGPVAIYYTNAVVDYCHMYYRHLVFLVGVGDFHRVFRIQTLSNCSGPLLG